MIIDFKETRSVHRPSSSFSLVLLKSDLHFAAKVRRRFCFQRQKAIKKERERDRERGLLFIRFVSFFRFQVGGGGSRYDKVVREEYTRRFRRLMRSLWHGIARAIVASHVYSKIVLSMKKPRKREDLRNTPHFILHAWMNCDRSGRWCHNLSLATIKISTYLSILSV